MCVCVIHFNVAESVTISSPKVGPHLVLTASVKPSLAAAAPTCCSNQSNIHALNLTFDCSADINEVRAPGSSLGIRASSLSVIISADEGMKLVFCYFYTADRFLYKLSCAVFLILTHRRD